MFKKARSSQYLVKAHNPRKAMLYRGVVVLAMLISCWAGFEYGRNRAGYDQSAAEAKIEALTKQTGILNARIDELTLENAQLASDSAIDATANQQVSQKLRKLNEEMLELKEELVFYRSLLSPAELEPGLQILGIQMARSPGNNTFDYKIVLTQRRNRDRYASGQVDLQLSGVRSGKQARLASDQMIENSKKSLKFKFKNFQRLEGSLSLPADFEPENVLVSVVPKDRRLKQVERSYEWNSIVTGG